MKKKIQKILDILTLQNIKHFEIFCQNSLDNSLEIKDGDIDTLKKTEECAFGIRIFLKDEETNHFRTGFSYGNDFSEEAIKENVKSALLSAPFSAPTIKSFVLPQKYEELNLFDSSISGQSNALRKERLMVMDEVCKKEPRIKNTRYVASQDGSAEKWLVNSGGVSAFHQKTYFSQGIMALAEINGESEMAVESIDSHFLKNIDPIKIGSKARDEAVSLLGGRQIENYFGQALLNPSVSSQILEVLAASFLAENIHKKNSFLIGKKDQKIYSKNLNLIDDGLHPDGLATSPFDGEGLPQQKTPVVKEGVVTHFLYDSYWALIDGVSSTGNSRRPNPFHLPKSGVTNFLIQKGIKTEEELFKQLNNGIQITDVIGMHTANPISGDFSVAVQGYVVKNGKRDYAIKSMAFSGNLHELFSNIIEVGSDFRFYNSFGAPSILVDKISVSGK